MMQREQKAWGQELIRKRHEGNLGADGDALYLGGGLCYTGAYICQSLLNSTFKFYVSHCMLSGAIRILKSVSYMLSETIFRGKEY